MPRTHRWPSTDLTLRVPGGGLTALIAPERGGKITSLVDSRGYEWLAQPHHAVGSPARSGEDFLKAEMAGWDECAPTIVACEVDGVALADHGELWTLPFTVDGLSAWVDDETLGYRFRRNVAVEPNGLRLDYTVTAKQRPVPFLWAAHPQLRAPEGSRVVLPSSVETVVDVLDRDFPKYRWSRDLGSVDTIGIGEYRKLYVHPEERVSSAALMHPDGSVLLMRWTSECAYLGLWFDRFDFRTDPIVALEPTTAYFDSLAAAVEGGRAPVIPPGGELAWSVRLEVLV